MFLNICPVPCFPETFLEDKAGSEEQPGYSGVKRKWWKAQAWAKPREVPPPPSCSQLWVLQSLMGQIVIVARLQGLGCGFSPGNWAR